LNPGDIVVCVNTDPCQWTPKNNPLRLIEKGAVYTIAVVITHEGTDITGVRLVEVNCGDRAFWSERFQLIYRLPSISIIHQDMGEPA
jgi:hypothetical protein